jgi:hypothetical protein
MRHNILSLAVLLKAGYKVEFRVGTDLDSTDGGDLYTPKGKRIALVFSGPVTHVVDGRMLVEKFCHTEKLEDHQDPGGNDAVVTFDTFVINFNHMTKYFDPMDTDTDIDTSDSRDYL